MLGYFTVIIIALIGIILLLTLTLRRPSVSDVQALPSCGVSWRRWQPVR